MDPRSSTCPWLGLPAPSISLPLQAHAHAACRCRGQRHRTQRRRRSYDEPWPMGAAASAAQRPPEVSQKEIEALGAPVVKGSVAVYQCIPTEEELKKVGAVHAVCGLGELGEAGAGLLLALPDMLTTVGISLGTCVSVAKGALWLHEGCRGAAFCSCPCSGAVCWHSRCRCPGSGCCVQGRRTALRPTRGARSTHGRTPARGSPFGGSMTGEGQGGRMPVVRRAGGGRLSGQGGAGMEWVP